jgi:hypothetical protein
MTRLSHAWAAMSRERRIAAVAALALLVTMFLPWYGLQSLNRKTGVIHSHDINAFGDVSFVEAAVFLVAAGVLVLLFARAEGREFNMPGGDGTIVALAGGWAGLLIFYRVFDRPDGNGYPVGVQWGFFLAFVAAGSLAYAGWRMRAGERPAPPVRRRRARPGAPGEDHGFERDDEGAPGSFEEGPPPEHESATAPAGARAGGEEDRRTATPEPSEETAPVGIAASRRAPAPPPAPAEPEPESEPTRRRRPRYPPAPGGPEQLSFEDPPPRDER